MTPPEVTENINLPEFPSKPYEISLENEHTGNEQINLTFDLNTVEISNNIISN